MLNKDTGKPIRVMHMVSMWGSGGSSVQIKDIYDSLDQAKVCTSKLCVLASTNTDLKRPVPPDGTVFLDYPGRLKDISATRACIRDLRAVIDKFQPDILHTYLWPSSLIGALAINNRRVRHVCHVLDTRAWLESPSLRHRIQRMIYYPALKKSGAHFIACADSVKRFLEKNLPQARENTSVVLNTVDVSLFDGARPARQAGTPVVIGNVGRLQEEKGQKYLLEAATILKERQVPFAIRFAGVGTQYDQYVEMAVRSGIIDQLEFLQANDNSTMADFYRNIDIFALPSLTEGLPLTVLEAMAMRLPIVASNIDGIPEAMTDGEEGFLVPTRDPEGLASAIEKLAHDPELRRTMGDKGFVRVHEQFASKGVGQKIAEIYRSVLETDR